jgi:hypothetical protein
MGKVAMTTSSENQFQQPTLLIEYCGPARRDAELLAHNLRMAGIAADDPVLSADAQATMAIGEIVVTIVASAAARALLDVAMEHLRGFLISRVQGTSQDSDAPNMQVLVAKPDGTVATRKLISLRVATADLITKFVKDVGNEVLRIASK